MSKVFRTRMIVGVAAAALLLSVLVGVAADFTADAGAMTAASVYWCRYCG